METLGYLHLACANELSEDSQLPVQPSSSGLLGERSWQRPPSAAWVKFLSIAIGLTILSIANAAMALTLQEGDRGSQVGDLQSQLASRGCYTGSIDEIFGSQTTAAVIECQQRLGLNADGIAGPATLAALLGSTSDQSFETSPTLGESTDTASGTLRLGSTGSAVSDLQNRLSAAGYYNGAIDGDFGQQTETAVVQFQRDRGLIDDGVVGSQVYQALSGSIAQPSSRPYISNSSNELTVGSSSSAVETLQRRLASLGYFDGPVTGYYGPLTTEAVTRYQRDNRISASGVANTQTLSSLGIGTADSYDRVNRFVVVVPKQDATTLARVRRFFPGAIEAKSKLGDYVQAGVFPNSERADRQSKQLRAQGLDARVAYR